MQQLSYQSAVLVPSLPPATPALAGTTARWAGDNQPYWCDGAQWVCLSASNSEQSPMYRKRVAYWSADTISGGYGVGMGGLVSMGRMEAGPATRAGSAVASTTKTIYGPNNASQPGGVRDNGGRAIISNGAFGGFFYSCRFCVPLSGAAQIPYTRRGVGLVLPSLGSVTIDPSTTRYGVVLGHSPSDSTWHIGYGGTVAQPKINLGPEFPVNETDVMQLDLWNDPGDARRVVNYRVTRIIDTNSRRVVQGKVPAGAVNGNTMFDSNVVLGHYCTIGVTSNDSNVLARSRIGLISVYIETPW